MPEQDIIEVNLSNCSTTTFSLARLPLSRSNFIFGRNGTGKSSIAQLIHDELGEQFNVLAFSGFDSIVTPDKKLNAIALGNENSDLQKQINDIDRLLEELELKLGDGGELRSEERKAEADQKNARRKYDDAIKNAARHLKNLENPRVVPISYNATGFKNDIIGPLSVIEADSVTKLKADAKVEQIELAPSFQFPEINVISLLFRANELLQQSISMAVLSPDLSTDSKKRAFAEHGREIHSRQHGERCAFCGSQIPDERWRQLDEFFSDATSELKSKLKLLIDEISNGRNLLDNVQLTSDSGFYPNFIAEAAQLQLEITNVCRSASTLLSRVSESLDQKLDDIFTVIEPFEESDPLASAFSLQEKYQDLLERNTKYSRNLDEVRSNAVSSLRKHEVASQFKNLNIEQLSKELDASNTILEAKQSATDSARETIKELVKQRSELQGAMKDEQKAAQNINNVLRNMGVDSFELTRIEQNEVGYYAIKDPTTGQSRDVTQLSTGEKNFIAFLYFLNQAKAPSESSQPRLFIFDDPMNSNDELYQFAILGALENLCRVINKGKGENPDRVVVLTHNVHFYLNLLPQGSSSYAEELRVYNLQRSGSETTVRHITSPQKNVKTSYAALWIDFYFAYENQRPNLMWNTLRRIISTYLVFNKLSEPTIMETEATEGKLLGRILKKSMDVNSHELLDFEAQSNQASVGEIKNYASDFFSRRENKKHFEEYWKYAKKVNNI